MATRAVEAVYEGENENVRTALNELAENAAAEAVEGMAFQQAVDAAETRAQAREQGVEISEGVKYSERRNRQNEDTTLLYKNKDLSTDKSLYDYDFLVSMPDIQVSTEGDLATVLDEDGHINHPKLKQQSLENAAQYGEVIDDGNVIVYNAYTNRPIRISSRGLDHSTHTSNQVKNQINARASLAAGELASKAIPLNAEYNKNAYALGTYAMAAPVQSVDGRKISVAVLTVEIRSGSIAKIEVYDLLHSLSVRKKNEGGLDGETPSPARLGHGDRPAATRSSYSIAEFLKIVNSTHQSLLSEV